MAYHLTRESASAAAGPQHHFVLHVVDHCGVEHFVPTRIGVRQMRQLTDCAVVENVYEVLDGWAITAEGRSQLERDSCAAH